MGNNIRIPIKVLQDDQLIPVKLEQDFDNLETLSMSISSSQAYSQMSADFGVIVGRVVLNNGFGLQNAKVSIFIPIEDGDKDRPEIFELYPFATPSDTLPNGVRYNLLPRVKNGRNPSHQAVGNFPDITDLTNYPNYLEVYEKYYKYTTITNEAGDYMIFGVPLGAQNIVMDFDLFDTKSFEVTANDLVAKNSVNNAILELQSQAGLTEDPNNIDKSRVPGFIYHGENNYDVELKTNLDEMPNIFHEVKQINVAPFWGDKDLYDIGITRCDFNIDFKFQPTAVFFGHLSSTTNTFSIKSDYSLSGKRQPEIYAKDSALGYEAGDIYPLQEFDIVIYKLDDKANPGSRQRIGVYKSYKGTGFFRLTLPMYLNYFTTNEYGDLIPSNDTSIGIPTTGYYAFEMYETNEAWRGTRNVWGAYKNELIPGIRIPSSSAGDKWLGGWGGTWDGKFEYDLFNKKRRFYTLGTTYRKHDLKNVLLDGQYVSYFPEFNTNKKDAYWNFPLDYRDTQYLDTVKIIGSTFIPRIEMTYDKESRLTDYPTSILIVPYKAKEDTFEKKIEDYEWFLGIGTQIEGTNSGPTFEDLFTGTDFMVISANGERKSIYGTIDTFNWGDNAKKLPFNVSLYALDLAQKSNANANAFKVHKAYTQAVSDYVTTGIFINASDFQVGKVKLFEVGIEDVTDALQDLIVNKMYSSYGVGGQTDTTPGDGQFHLQNAFKGNYYFFGYWKGMNALYDIEKNYFNIIA